jgi:hypothetical protein
MRVGWFTRCLMILICPSVKPFLMIHMFPVQLPGISTPRCTLIGHVGHCLEEFINCALGLLANLKQTGKVK